MAVDWLQKVLAHHDPLGAWPPTASSNRDYGLEARLGVRQRFLHF
jgi:hypothetical protein